MNTPLEEGAKELKDLKKVGLLKMRFKIIRTFCVIRKFGKYAFILFKKKNTFMSVYRRVFKKRPSVVEHQGIINLTLFTCFFLSLSLNNNIV